MSAIGRVGSVKPTTSGADLKELLVPYPADQMELWPVDKPVGSVKNEFLFYVLRRHRLRHVTISLRLRYQNRKNYLRKLRKVYLIVKLNKGNLRS